LITDWKERLQIIEQFEQETTTLLKSKRTSELFDQLDRIFDKCLEYSNDQNFKINLISIKIIQKLSDHFKSGLSESLVNKLGVNLVLKLSDSKLII
jgi:hypothetical protein